MFDTYITRQSPAYPQNISVTEKKASTAEDVRLLKELEKEAESKVTAEIIVNIGTNNVNGTIISEFNNMTRMKSYYSVFSLNSKEYKVKIEFPDMTISKEEMVRKLYKEFGHAIAEELIRDNLSIL